MMAMMAMEAMVAIAVQKDVRRIGTGVRMPSMGWMGWIGWMP